MGNVRNDIGKKGMETLSGIRDEVMDNVEDRLDIEKRKQLLREEDKRNRLEGTRKGRFGKGGIIKRVPL